MPVFDWGDFEWADADWNGGDILATRLLRFNREGPIFRAIADIIDTRQGAIFAVIESLLLAFDLESAAGEQLDIVGNWLGRPRDGLTDYRYRKAIDVQLSSILSSAGSIPVMLQIFEKWTGNVADLYRSIPPAEIQMGGLVQIPDEFLLGIFLRDAAPGGVVLNVWGYDPDTVLRGDYSPSPISGVGTTDYHAGDTIAGAAPTAFLVHP